jgi:hypothetical protein
MMLVGNAGFVVFRRKVYTQVYKLIIQNAGFFLGGREGGRESLKGAKGVGGEVLKQILNK